MPTRRRGLPTQWERRGRPLKKIDALIEERIAAKANRDFERADQIRDDLEAQGVVLEDGPDGTQWRRRS